jgi:hypothetical protein
MITPLKRYSHAAIHQGREIWGNVVLVLKGETRLQPELPGQSCNVSRRWQGTRSKSCYDTLGKRQDLEEAKRGVLVRVDGYIVCSVEGTDPSFTVNLWTFYSAFRNLSILAAQKYRLHQSLDKTRYRGVLRPLV